MTGETAGIPNISEVQKTVEGILKDYRKERAIDQIDRSHQPDRQKILEVVQGLLQIVYPGYYRDSSYKIYHVDNWLPVKMENVMYHLEQQIRLALPFRTEPLSTDGILSEAGRISGEFFRLIPAVREVLDTDVQAAFSGDPAAKCREEIILSYPGLFAITVYRLAHELFLRNVPLIPRIMTEYAHSLTGIDIHPGAEIGKYFFIDHGTGIVIGETAVIGEHVKIYQGVTIGAISTREGQKLRDVKRHPTIQDHVTIYAGASILGGETIIGRNSVIGGNAFITASVPENTKYFEHLFAKRN